MAMVISISEFLKNVGRLKTIKEKVEAIKANDSYPLRVVLQAAYDPSVEFDLPEGDVPYTPNTKVVDQQHVLIRDARMIQYFVKGLFPNLSKHKREMMFIEFLERLDPADAELIVRIKNKLPIRGITKEQVMEALPGLINNEPKHTHPPQK